MIPVLVILLVLPAAAEEQLMLGIQTGIGLDNAAQWKGSTTDNIVVVSTFSKKFHGIGLIYLCGFDSYYGEIKPITYQIWNEDGNGKRTLKKEFGLYTPPGKGRQKNDLPCPYILAEGDLIAVEQANGPSIAIKADDTRTNLNDITPISKQTNTTGVVTMEKSAATPHVLYAMGVWIAYKKTACPSYTPACDPTTLAPTTKEPTTLEPTTSEPTTLEPTTSESTTLEPTTKPESSSGGKKKTGGCRPATGTAESTVYNKPAILTALLCFFLLI